MNDAYREFKVRLRTLEVVLQDQGFSNVAFAQALSRVRRAERRGDRTREPSTELVHLLERAEALVQKAG